MLEEKPEHSALLDLSNYLVDTYIDENSTYPPNIRAAANTDVERTTNGCKAFHSKFNGSFTSSHLNIFKFISIILDFQIDTYVKNFKFRRRGAKPSSPKRKQLVY